MAEPVSTNDLAEVANEVRRTSGNVAVRSRRRVLVKRALAEGMHPWTVAFYSQLSEGYVRSLTRKGA